MIISAWKRASRAATIQHFRGPTAVRGPKVC